MEELFNADFFLSNRRKLLGATKADLIVITASSLVQKSADASFPFKQDPNFWYLTGSNEPDLVLVITNSEDYLIVPKLDSTRQIFDGRIDEVSLLATSKVKKLYNEKEGWQKLSQQLKQADNVGLLMASPTKIKRYGFYSQPARRYLVQKLKRINKALNFEDLRPTLARLRMIKQPAEIKAIQKAIDITSDTLKEVLPPNSLSKYNYAYQIEAAIAMGFRSRGANGHGFEPIVANGKNATVIHYLKNDQRLIKGQLIVIDVGSEYAYYSADIARTVSYGQPSARQIEVFTAVREVQSEAMKLIKPGINYREYEKQVEKLVGQQLIKLGLINKLDRKSIRRYYPHACSHSLGLDPHDSCDYSQPLPVNMVLTVEPGIYIPEEGIGVRLEDDLLITKSGHKVLSCDLASSLQL